MFSALALFTIASLSFMLLKSTLLRLVPPIAKPVTALNPNLSTQSESSPNKSFISFIKVWFPFTSSITASNSKADSDPTTIPPAPPTVFCNPSLYLAALPLN